MSKDLSYEQCNLVIDAIEYQLSSLERQTNAKRKNPAIAEAYNSLHRQYQQLLHHFRELAGQIPLALEPEPSGSTKRSGK